MQSIIKATMESALLMVISDQHQYTRKKHQPDGRVEGIGESGEESRAVERE